MTLQDFLDKASLGFKSFAVANGLLPSKPSSINIVNKIPSFIKNFFLDNQGIAAITFGNTIFYFDEITEQILMHELVHVRQYKELGFFGFLKKYLKEYKEKGYSSISLEIEAYSIAGDFSRRKGYDV